MSAQCLWLWLLSGLLLLAACTADPAEPLNLAHLNQEIHRLTNQMRAEKGLAPLAELAELNTLSQVHSSDMAQRQFFDHVNPDGQDAFDRMQALEPDLLSVRSGENIVMQSLHGLRATAVAEQLLVLWRESPEHYAHIMDPEFWHLGVGVAVADKKIYATQTFAAAVVRLDSPRPERLQPGSSLNLSFRFLAPFPKAELSAFFYAPDPSARIPTGTGGFYIGKGPVALGWQSERAFSIQLATDYGQGTYRLSFGRQQAYYDAPYEFLVSSP